MYNYDFITLDGAKLLAQDILSKYDQFGILINKVVFVRLLKFESIIII